jgi:hypothetical protein
MPAFARGPDPTYPVSSPDSSRIFNGTEAVFPQFAVINTGTTSTIIPGIPGLIIRVIAMDLVVSAATTISWQSVTAATLVSGPQSFAANGGIVRNFNQSGWFQTQVGDSLGIIVAGASSIGGNITYIAL